MQPNEILALSKYRLNKVKEEFATSKLLSGNGCDNRH